MAMMFDVSASFSPAGRARELRPPWVAYPELAPGDYGWRTEPGETYLNRWAAWFYEMDMAQREAYLQRHRPPVDWAACSDCAHS